MRYALFLPAALLLLGCQPQSDPQLTRLQTQLTAQQDTLRRLHRELAGQQDSVRRVRQRLARTQEILEETAQMANYIMQGEAGPARARPRAGALPAGTLYGKPAIVRLPDEEMAEVLALADTTTSSTADDYSITAYRACNGPSDATLDYCNCSHYVYLALGTNDLPNEYKLFRIGPFYEARFAGWGETKASGPQPADGGPRGYSVLRIRHDLKGRSRTDTFRVSWQGVQQL